VTFRRFPLATLPTPLTRAERLERALDAPPIWIKRDDLTGYATAGTKARALEFLIADAQACGAATVVATGSPSSNFCAVAALAARTAGLGCHVLYAGPRPAPLPHAAWLADAAGARLCFDPDLTRDDLDEAVVVHAANLRAPAYPLRRGGASGVGAIGCVYAARELGDQLREPATVVVATGSGGSQAGLVAGVVGFGLPLRVIGASVSRPVEQAHERVFGLAGECARLLRTVEPAPSDVDVRDAIGSGFGAASDDDRRSADLALRHEGLLLDDTYTAKSMTLLRELVRSGVDGPVVFWNTGGQDAALRALGGGE
jgi:D-cysteine desulfhydrase